MSPTVKSRPAPRSRWSSPRPCGRRSSTCPSACRPCRLLAGRHLVARSSSRTLISEPGQAWPTVPGLLSHSVGGDRACRRPRWPRSTPRSTGPTSRSSRRLTSAGHGAALWIIARSDDGVVLGPDLLGQREQPVELGRHHVRCGSPGARSIRRSISSGVQRSISTTVWPRWIEIVGEVEHGRVVQRRAARGARGRRTGATPNSAEEPGGQRPPCVVRVERRSAGGARPWAGRWCPTCSASARRACAVVRAAVGLSVAQLGRAARSRGSRRPRTAVVEAGQVGRRRRAAGEPLVGRRTPSASLSVDDVGDLGRRPGAS